MTSFACSAMAQGPLLDELTCGPIGNRLPVSQDGYFSQEHLIQQMLLATELVHFFQGFPMI